MRDPEAVTFPQQAEAIISAAALYADKERPDLAQEVQDVDLPCNIPGSKGIGAPFSRLDPVHPAAELLKPADDVAVRVDDADHDLAGGTGHDAPFAKEQSGDDSTIGIAFDVKGPRAQRVGAADAHAAHVLAHGVFANAEKCGNLRCAHTVPVKLANLVFLASQHAASSVRAELDATVSKERPQWGHAASVAHGQLIETRAVDVGAGDVIADPFQPRADSRLIAHALIIYREIDNWCGPTHLPFFGAAGQDQCQDARVPYLFKQWGAHRWIEHSAYDHATQCWVADGIEPQRVSKKLAGRELDGRTWDEYPRVYGVAA